jgi:uncharacterized protein
VSLLEITAHRAYPPASEPWLLWQQWTRLLFAHWPVPSERLRSLIPSELELDTFNGTAWLGIVPFQMEITLRGFQKTPIKKCFNEINVRTYVQYSGQHPGVYFLSLDADDLLAVLGARIAYQLPYHKAHIECQTQQSPGIYYKSHRTHGPAANFEAIYQPVSQPFQSQPGSFEYWLTERYCLYTRGPAGDLCVGEIHHPPWMLQNAQADWHCNTMTSPYGIELPLKDVHLLYADYQEIYTWPLKSVHTIVQAQ